MLITHIVQAVLFIGMAWLSVLTVRVLVEDIRDHKYRREMGLDADGFKIPVDFDGSMRRQSGK